MTKKEKSIKDINVKQLNANWRTGMVIVAVASITVGLVIGYFGAINIITDSQHKAIDVVSSLTQLKH